MGVWSTRTLPEGRGLEAGRQLSRACLPASFTEVLELEHPPWGDRGVGSSKWTHGKSGLFSSLHSFLALCTNTAMAGQLGASQAAPV